MSDFRIYLNGYYKGRTDDEDKVRRLEDRASWNGRPVSRSKRSKYSVYIGRRR